MVATALDHRRADIEAGQQDRHEQTDRPGPDDQDRGDIGSGGTMDGIAQRVRAGGPTSITPPNST